MGRSRQSLAVTMLLITIVVRTAVADTLLPEGINIQVTPSGESQKSLEGVSIPRNPSTDMSRQLRVLEELELAEMKRKAENLLRKEEEKKRTVAETESKRIKKEVEEERRRKSAERTRSLTADESSDDARSPAQFQFYTVLPDSDSSSTASSSYVLRIEQPTPTLEPGTIELISSSVIVIYTDDGNGAGVIVDETGLAVTNWHVVANAIDGEVSVRLSHETIGAPQELTMGDVIKVSQEKDLALIRMRPDLDLVAINLGRIDDVFLGMLVHAIGHPLGHDWTYTRGIVSKIRKNFMWPVGKDPNNYHRATVIQTQTPINPGNSGGPLFNSKGQLIGINSFSSSNADGIHFAVAVNEVRNFFRDIPPKLEPNLVYPEPLSEYSIKSFDRDNDGRTELYGFDTNNNGTIDLWALDIDGDDKADDGEWYLDNNENGKIDGLIIDAKNYKSDLLGKLWFIDVDEDGDRDMMGHDIDGDGRVDRWRRVS